MTPPPLAATSAANGIENTASRRARSARVERRKDQNAFTINVAGRPAACCIAKSWAATFKRHPGRREHRPRAPSRSTRWRSKMPAALALNRKPRSKARAQGMRGTTLVNRLAGSQRRTPICWARGITCALPDTLRWLPDAYHGPSGAYSARQWWPTCSPPAAFTGPSSPSRASGCPSRPR